MGAILLCDACGTTGGATPAPTGAMARMAAYRGTIRRVVVGWTVVGYGLGEPAQRAAWAVDLCGACRASGAADTIRGHLRSRVEANGKRWEDAA